MKIKILNLIILLLCFKSLFALQEGSPKNLDFKKVAVYSFGSLFPKSAFSKAHQMSKKVWTDVLLYIKNQRMCLEGILTECANQKREFDGIVDHVLQFHHAVKDVQKNPLVILDDVEHVNYILDQIKLKLSGTKEQNQSPEYFCVQVVLDKIENILDRLVKN